jgi:hypothetical protein
VRVKNVLETQERVMNWQLYMLGMVGGVLPEALRFVAWARDRSPDRGPRPLVDSSFWISIGVGALLGPLAVHILEPTTRLQATAFGFAAPEFLTGAFAAVAGKKAPDRAAAPPLNERLIDRWQP